MYSVYVPYDNLNSFTYYYYNEDLTIIYATNDNENYDIIDLNNHYNIINSNLDLHSKLLIPINKDNLTNDWTYRKDLTDVLISFFFFVMFFVGIPITLLFKFVKRKFIL